MAERRMFAKTIIDSDAFLDMPISARLLYYDLGMRADDDGFVNSPKKIMKIIGATNDDMNILIMRKFIIPFESGIVVIKHWRINNYLRKDRYNETKYIKEKNQLVLDGTGKYHSVDTNGIPHGIPTGIPTVDTGKVSIGKDSLDKDINNDSKESSYDYTEESTVYQWLVDAWNELEEFGIATIRKIPKSSPRVPLISARLKQYSEREVLEAIENIKQSDFLLGRRTDFIITFDWFIKPKNFVKVLEGNYRDKTHPSHAYSRRNQEFHSELEQIASWAERSEGHDQTGIW